MSLTLTQVLKRTLEESGLPAKLVAQQLGMPYSTLMNQLNDSIPNAVFRANDLVRFMRVVGSNKPIDWLAGQMGMYARTLPEVNGQKCLHTHCLRALAATTAFFDAATQGKPCETISALLTEAVGALEGVAYQMRSTQKDCCQTCPDNCAVSRKNMLSIVGEVETGSVRGDGVIADAMSCPRSNKACAGC